MVSINSVATLGARLALALAGLTAGCGPRHSSVAEGLAHLSDFASRRADAATSACESMWRIMPGGEDVAMYRHEVHVAIHSAESTEAIEFQIKPDFQATAVKPLAENAFALAGTRPDEVLIERYQLSFNEMRRELMVEEQQLYRTTAYARIDQMTRATIRGQEGILFLDLYDGALVWASLSGGVSIELANKASCPEILEMRELWASNEPDRSLRISLRDSESDHLVKSDRYLILLDKEADGKIDSITKEGGW